jgi:hypothetical protein
MANTAEQYGLRPVRKLMALPLLTHKTDIELQPIMAHRFTKVTW